MSRQHRWTCPSCGSTKLAPKRPRRDDTRRYCLHCSEKTGHLVARTCPVLETRRDSRRAARQVRAEARAERQQARAKTYPYLLEEVARSWYRLDAWDGVDLRGEVGLVIRRYKKRVWSTGHYRRSGGRIVVTAGLYRADAYYTVLHELAHAVHRERCPWDSAHGERYWALLFQAGVEVTGVRVTRGTALLRRGLAAAFEGLAGDEGRPIYKES